MSLRWAHRTRTRFLPGCRAATLGGILIASLWAPSGGSAAARCADFCVIATGTDTGAAIVSLRFLRTHTDLSEAMPYLRLGMIAYASSLDQAGPISKSQKTRLIDENAMAGSRPPRLPSVDIPAPDFTANLNDSLQGCAWCRTPNNLAEGLDANVEKSHAGRIKVF